MDPELEGFLKEAGVKSWLLKGLARGGRAARDVGSKVQVAGKSMADQVASGGVKARAPGKGLGWARGELGSTAEKTVTRKLVDKGRTAVRKRMMVRGAVGAGVGVGHEAMTTGGEGREFSMARAMGKGLLGGAAGVAAGTTVGKRSLRRIWQNKSTPNAPLSHTIKTPGKSFARTQVDNFKNLSPLEKGYSAMTAADLGSAAFGSNPQGDRGARLGGSLGEGAAILIGGRWRGQRRIGMSGRKGSLGAMARQGGLFAGSSVAGSAIGGLADKKKAPLETVLPGSNRLHEVRRRTS